MTPLDGEARLYSAMTAPGPFSRSAPEKEGRSQARGAGMVSMAASTSRALISGCLAAAKRSSSIIGSSGQAVIQGFQGLIHAFLEGEVVFQKVQGQSQVQGDHVLDRSRAVA